MQLPKNYEPKVSEPKWQEYWDGEGIFKFNLNEKKPIYSIDTPPPTISGYIHVGHAYSYSQAEFIARYKRMRGFNVFYPFGFDDNGLPSERYVEKQRKIRAKDIPRNEFIKICLEETKKAADLYKKIWTRIGISCDWSLAYSTINDRCRKTSQLSFLELYKSGRIHQKEAPIMWCPECQTAIAQVELEDKELDSEFVYMAFETEDNEKITIATTRPEMMAACVAIYVHPEDKRYKHLVGKNAKLPFYGRKVRIEADASVDPEFGSGIVYHCTFGDVKDIEWVQSHDLPIIEIISKDGTMNEKAGKYRGMKIKEARKSIIADLESAGLLQKKEPIRHVVNVHERCGTEIEFITTMQWFVKYLDLKEKFLELGKEMKWHPGHFKSRYDNWVSGLKWDWCISRQRYYGVAFPVWYCKKCSEVMLPDEKELPVDPFTDKPSKKCRCGSNEFIPEKDILDTWFTSSLTPQINCGWKEDDKRFKKLFPMSLRPQAHDIISFWLFHTVVKGYLHNKSIPFNEVMISGWGLDSKGKKMSKSKGNVIEPLAFVEKYSADALRFWAASSKLGEDLWFSEKEFIAGQRTATKLWNACKFSIMHLENYTPSKKPKLEIIDKWALSKLQRLVKESTEAFDSYDYAKVRLEVDKFFWHTFCDNYLEISKWRIYGEDEEQKESARYTLYNLSLSILKMFAPIMPHIAEELYQLYFAETEKKKSIHVSEWPEYDEKLADKESEEAGDMAVELVSAVRKHKSERNLSLKEEIAELVVECDEKTKRIVNKIEEDVKQTMKIKELSFGKGETELRFGMRIGIR